MKRLIIASMIAATFAVTPMLANAETPATPAATQQVAESLKISQQGLRGVQDIQLARLAIFHGQPDSAVKLVDAAAKQFADDSADWKQFVQANKKATLIDDHYVAINGTIGVNEDFIATPEKQAAIKKANEKFAKGDEKGAIEDLRLANIGIVQHLYLLPLKQAQKGVAEAQKLLADKHYYEANLVLKSVEDSILIDSTAIIAN